MDIFVQSQHAVAWHPLGGFKMHEQNQLR